MTVHEAHKEYNSLIDQIWAKYELLDSGECGSVGTPAFNAECSKLAHLMAHMSELCVTAVGLRARIPGRLSLWLDQLQSLHAVGHYSSQSVTVMNTISYWVGTH